MKKIQLTILFGLVLMFAVMGTVVFAAPNTFASLTSYLTGNSSQPSKKQIATSQERGKSGAVLAATDEVDSTAFETDVRFEVNIPAVFNNTVTFTGASTFDNLSVTQISATDITTETLVITSALTAPNILYSLTGDDGLEITGDQGLTIVNTDKGSSQNIFKNLKYGDSTASAGSNSDTFEFVAGTNIGLALDTSTKKLTITNSYSPPAQPWTLTGTSVHLTTATNTVDIGGDITLGDATTDSITMTARLASGTSILPMVDLGSDLGSASLRFNNIYVGTINTNSTLSTAGQAVFTYEPTSTAYTQASVLINPTAPPANSFLLGLGQGGFQRAGIDEDGDLSVGYNDQISIPTSDYPLNVYGHNGTRVAYIDENGNAFFSGSVGGSYTQGSVLFQGASAVTQDNSNFFWDDSSNELGIGTSNPSSILHVRGTSPTFTLEDSSNGTTLAFGLSGGARTISSGGTLSITGTPVRLCSGFCSTGANRTTSLFSGWDAANSSSEALSIAINAGRDFTYTGALINVTGTYKDNAGSKLLDIQNNGTSRFNVQADGKVGIGTSAPTNQLHIHAADGVSPEMRFSEGAGLGLHWNKIFLSTSSQLLIYRAGFNQSSVDGHVWQVDTGAEMMRLNGLGRLGLGTSSPDAKLHVSGAATGKALAIFNETGNQSPLTASVSGSTVFVVNNVGEVGINTASPANSGLTIYSSSNPALTFGNSTRPPSNSLNKIFLSSTGRNMHYRAGFNNGATYGHVFEQNTGTEIFRTDGLKIGIGTSSPDGQLHLTGAATGKALAILNETGDQNIFTASASGTTRFVIQNDGNVGIGTTSPAYPLAVNNTIYGGTALRVTTTAGGSEGISIGAAGGGVMIHGLRISGTTGNGISISPAANGTGVSVTPYGESGRGYYANAGGSSRGFSAISSSNGYSFYGADDGSGTAAYFTSTNGKALIVDDGRTGLGTTNPLAKLHVSGGYAGNALAIFNETNGQDLLTASASGTTIFTVRPTSGGQIFLKDNGSTGGDKIFIGNGIAINQLNASAPGLSLRINTSFAGTGTWHTPVTFNRTSTIFQGSILTGFGAAGDAGLMLGGTDVGYAFKLYPTASRTITLKSDHTNSSPTWPATIYTINGDSGTAANRLFDIDVPVEITTSQAGVATLRTKALTGQTSNLFEARDVNSNPLTIIDVNGNVGIGTTSNLSKKLTVNDAIGTTSEGDIFSQYDGGSATWYPIIARYWDANGTYPASTYIFGNGASSRVGIEKPGGADITHLQVKATKSTFTGTLGIGNTDPQVALHVGGTGVTDATSLLRLEDANSTCNFTADSGSPSCGSDATLKKDIASLDTVDLLTRVSNLRPVSYRWNSQDSNAAPQFGFIAQEVEAQFPELVKMGTWVDGTQRKFLNTGGLMPYVIGAVKEQQLQISQLQLANQSQSGLTSQSTTSAQLNSNGDITLEDRVQDLEDKVAENTSAIGQLQTTLANLFKTATTFLADVTFKGRLLLSPDQTGVASIPAGSTKVKVTFSSKLPVTPVIQLTPRQQVLGAVFIPEVTDEYFVIEMAEIQTNEVNINWSADLQDATNDKKPTVEVIDANAAAPTPTVQPTPSPVPSTSPVSETPVATESGGTP